MRARGRVAGPVICEGVVRMCGPGRYPGTPAGIRQALAALNAALACLAAADAGTLTAAEQADCLRGLQRAESMRIAAQSAVLTAFAEGCGHRHDGHGTARSWLRWQARITGTAASAAVSWARRLAAHPSLADALARGAVSESWARQIADWTDLLPAPTRPGADAILLAAAAAGATLADLAGLAEEMRSRSGEPDRDHGDPEDRSLRLTLHYRGAGRLRGDLTPRCAAAVRAMLEALGKKKGPEDVRTQAQRDHDALEDACQRLIASGKLPDRAGQPTQILLLANLDDLLARAAGTGEQDSPPPHGTSSAPSSAASSAPPSSAPPSSAPPSSAGTSAAGDGTEAARRRLFPRLDDLISPQPGELAVPGPLATPGDLCDASIVPVVTGHVDHELLDRLAARLLSDTAPLTDSAQSGDRGSAARSGAGYARDLILRHAVALLSGPGGLASRLRTGTLTGPAASVSLPLDCGTATETIPAHIRRAVTLRDQHCGFPGCTDTHCQVHHIIPVSQGGETSLANCTLGCLFHHLIAIHVWGWKLLLNADGTKTAISPDGSRILHTHDPPLAA